MNEPQQERLIELLTDQALSGLNEEELSELNQLKKQFPEWEKNVSFELVAAAIGLTDLNTAETLPANLRTKVLADADRFFSRAEKTRNVVSFPTQRKENIGAAGNRAVGSLAANETKRPFWQWLGWGIAAAACVALAVTLWLSANRPPKEIVKTIEVVQTPTPELSPAQKRERLLASAPDVIQTNWTSPKDESEVLGDIVWSNSRQEGYIRLRGLPVIDPSKETYQLWIADKTRNPKTLLSAGIFNVSQTGEVVIPVDAQLQVGTPAGFNITKEKPGGVVVPDLERIVAIAKI